MSKRKFIAVPKSIPSITLENIDILYEDVRNFFLDNLSLASFDIEVVEVDPETGFAIVQ